MINYLCDSCGKDTPGRITRDGTYTHPDGWWIRIITKESVHEFCCVTDRREVHVCSWECLCKFEDKNVPSTK